jgi:hypothetical protein
MQTANTKQRANLGGGGELARLLQRRAQAGAQGRGGLALGTGTAQARNRVSTRMGNKVKFCVNKVKFGGQSSEKAGLSVQA